MDPKWYGDPAEYMTIEELLEEGHCLIPDAVPVFDRGAYGESLPFLDYMDD